MNKLSLFDISIEFQAMHDLIENDLEINEETGEITDNSLELQQLFNELSLTFEEKLDNTQRYILTLDGEADILDKEIKRLQAKKKAIENKKEKLKNIVMYSLDAAKQSKYKTSLYSFNIRESESTKINDFDLIPRQFLRIKTEADKKAIKESIKEGYEIPGAEIVKNKSITIK